MNIEHKVQTSPTLYICRLYTVEWKLFDAKFKF